jgi:hypothetical protein
MGIFKLNTKYICNKEYCVSKPEIINGNEVRIPRVLYYDITSEIYKIHGNYIKNNKSISDVLQYFALNLRKRLSSYSKYYQRVYVFVDFKVNARFHVDDIYFEEILDNIINSFDSTEHQYATTLINSNGEIISSYELKYLESSEISDYRSLDYLYEQTGCQKYKDKKHIGYIRYLLTHYAKYNTVLERSKQRRKLEMSADEENVPIQVIIKCLPAIIGMIKLNNVEYFGCEIESDFALVKHIHLYNRCNLPMIITCDSDFIALLCDVECFITIIIRHEASIINPKLFWHKIFGADLDRNIILLVCTLLGTDYNIHLNNSTIHIDDPDELLSLVSKTTWNEVEPADILGYIQLKYYEDPSESVLFTTLAVNILLNSYVLERSIHVIEPKNVDINKLMIAYRSQYRVIQ